MSVRTLVASLGVTAIAVAAAVLPAAASYADAVTDVYVVTPANGGDDAHDCSQANPCATVARAIFAADASGTTINVGAGTFDAPLRPGALSKSVDIVGVSPADTILTNTALDGFVVEVDSGITSLSQLTVTGGFATAVLVDGTGILMADHVVLENAACPLAVFAGGAQVTDSTLQNGGSGDCRPVAGPGTPLTGDVAVSGGSASLVRTQVLSPATNTAGIVQTGGTVSMDQSYVEDPHNSDNSHGIEIASGTATITGSVFHGWGQGVDAAGGSVVVSDSTFQDNLVGVNRDAGSATVVRSTFQHGLASLQGTVAVAGSVLGSMLGTPGIGIRECAVDPVTDLGYNLSTDATCGFTQTTSHENVTGLPGSGVDTIPANATYGASSTPLCAGTDLRGVPRPQAGACDAGSVELVTTTTTLQAPATAKPHAAVTLDATVDVHDVGVDGLGLPTGSVTFKEGATVLCQDVLVALGHAACTSSALAAGSHSLAATFTPADGSTLHSSSSAPRTLQVGTVPAFTSKGKATFVVGKSRTFQVRASGSPSARITLAKGKLPAGLRFHAGNGSATISGKAKASAVGTRSVTVRATNLRGTAQQVLRIVVTRH
jgi:hypothetical protein